MFLLSIPKKTHVYIVHCITAIVFGIVYGILIEFDSNSFTMKKQKGHTYSFYEKVFEGLYFSCITQTTIGFGDVVPKSYLAKVVVILQSLSVFGIFYFFV